MRIPTLVRRAIPLMVASVLAVALGMTPVAAASGIPAHVTAHPPTTFPCFFSGGAGGSGSGISLVSSTSGAHSVVSPWSGASQMGTAPAFPMSVTPGAVTVAVGASHYGLCGSIAVGVANGLNVPIYATDHHTSCSMVTLERRVGTSWQPVGGCPMGLVTRMRGVGAGAVVGVTLSPSGGFGSTAWPAGTYRICLTYSLAGPWAAQPLGVPFSHLSTVYSPTFQIA